MSHHPSIAVVGATGAVGREMLAVLEQRRFPHSSIRLLASPRSAGQKITYRGEAHLVLPLTAENLRGVDLALFSAGSGPSKEFAPGLVAAGASVVDNSSAFRADPTCHLIVPEVNGGTLAGALAARAKQGLLCAVPNCSAIIMLVALNPLREAFGITRIVVSTYQAASGAGAQAMDELRAQSHEALAGKSPEQLTRRVFPEPYAFNLFSHNAAVDPATGYNGEELKMISEARRIWNDPAPGVLISPTCIRVPTMRAHAESINVTLRRAATEREVREVLSKGAGVRIVDDRAANAFPTPLKATGGDDVLVGRIRPDIARVHELHGPAATVTPDTRCDQWSLFVAGDQLRTGAALTAVKIAELLV
ncbi:MAG: aspartate-semialdehyde dehydrogenase [Phycisphaerales bacterium]